MGAKCPLFFAMKKSLAFILVCLLAQLQGQGTLQFNQIKLISANTDLVPASKVWEN